VAIKTVVFLSDQKEHKASSIASEAAIASNLAHKNIVATYSHDICNVSSASQAVEGTELDIYKFYLIQVRFSV
jgi:hypothetical protein